MSAGQLIRERIGIVKPAPARVHSSHFLLEYHFGRKEKNCSNSTVYKNLLSCKRCIMVL